jgi:hypothetical protein
MSRYVFPIHCSDTSKKIPSVLKALFNFIPQFFCRYSIPKIKNIFQETSNENNSNDIENIDRKNYIMNELN